MFLQDVIEGFIWRVICTRIFASSATELCRDPGWRAYSQLVDQLKRESATPSVAISSLSYH